MTEFYQPRTVAVTAAVDLFALVKALMCHRIRQRRNLFFPFCLPEMEASKNSAGHTGADVDYVSRDPRIPGVRSVEMTAKRHLKCDNAFSREPA